MKRAFLFLLLALVFLVCLGCGRSKSDKEESKAEEEDFELPVVSEDQKILAQGNNEFAWDLYQRLSKEEGNLVFSPYSISTALAMTYAGARGQTAEEMAKVLRFSLPPHRLHQAFKELGNGLRAGKKRPFQLHVANSLWGQAGAPFVPDFLNLIQDKYQGGLRQVDFQTGPEAARKEINQWVEKQTKNKIVEIIQEGLIERSTAMVLANAIYFKGAWAFPFPLELTKDGIFHLSAAQKITVPMMSNQENLLYFQGDGVKFLELPYEGRSLSMFVLLPEGKELVALEKSFSSGKFQGWITKLKTHSVIVKLPKFKIIKDYQLKDYLVPMGMVQAFEEVADFSGIVPGPIRFCLKEVVHKTFINLNEQGTEAAAATADIGVIPVSGFRPPLANFFADRPFLFMISHKKSGAILFLGRVGDPLK